MQIERSVRDDSVFSARLTGGVEAVFGPEGAILGLEGAGRPEGGGLIDVVVPVVGDAISIWPGAKCHTITAMRNQQPTAARMRTSAMVYQMSTFCSMQSNALQFSLSHS